MFDYLNGILTDKILDDNSSATIDINGVGYLVAISQRDFNCLPDINESVKLFTILVHKEDVMMLYGFLNKDARNIFKILTSVSGVGPKMAIQLLNEFDPAEIISIVTAENHKELTRTKGVGAKLAQKIVLELKDKFKDCIVSPATNKVVTQTSQSLDDAKNVLISFGYEQEEISDALNYALDFVHKDDDAEDILKFALKFLSKEL
ncbi:Holliday junction branch migration protein RuvA [bacterium]|nr:Holliday junction branch migration protein RuvA [bacterium]